jgi:hypothetical protein
VRAALLESWKFLSARRDHFGAGMATPFFAAWLEDAIDNGTITLPKGAPDFWEAYAAYTQCRWNGPPRGWVDPTKEVEAAIMRMEGGLTTLQDEAQEAGSDWMSTAQQQAYERNYRATSACPRSCPPAPPRPPITTRPTRPRPTARKAPRTSAATARIGPDPRSPAPAPCAASRASPIARSPPEGTTHDPFYAHRHRGDGDPAPIAARRLRR